MGIELSDRGLGYREDEKEPKVFLVTSAPGTGKTYVLNERILEFIAQIKDNPVLLWDDFSRRASQVEPVTEEDVRQLVRDTEAEIKRNELMEAIKADLIEPLPLQVDKVDEQKQPPTAAKHVICLFLEEKDSEIVIGDLYEKYERERKRRGKRRADMWLYYEVARSVWPLVRRFVLRISGRILRTKQAD